MGIVRRLRLLLRTWLIAQSSAGTLVARSSRSENAPGVPVRGLWYLARSLRWPDVRFVTDLNGCILRVQTTYLFISPFIALFLRSKLIFIVRSHSNRGFRRLLLTWVFPVRWFRRRTRSSWWRVTLPLFQRTNRGRPRLVVVVRG